MDLGSKTNDQLFDRLAELEQVVPDADAASLTRALREVALIHIELAKRTASGVEGGQA